MMINSNEFQLKDESKAVLVQWKKEPLPEENRIEAENRIFDFFSCVEKDFLDLSNLNLTSLPDIFNDFSSRLKRLFLNHNQLKTLPDTIGNLSALTELDLGSNKFSSLPDTIIHLTALKSLRINNKLITKFPDIITCLSTLSQKQQLDNSLNRWVKESSPEENRAEAKDRIFEFFNNEKEDLNLSDLNLNSLPNIFDYPCFHYRLTELNLSRNKLTTLPDTIGNLSKLTYLYLAENKLEALPDMSGMDVLHYLDLSRNKLTILPDTIGNLSRLTYLSLAENKLEALPDAMGNLSSLARLDLDENKLENLFDMSGMLELNELSLRKNKLKILPDTIGNLSKLTYLYLAENKLEALPDMSGMDVLYHLDLSSNKLTTLPDTIRNLSGLTYLYLNKNELETLPNMSGMQKLEELDLSHNKLTTLPDTIGNLSSLARLDLDENELESLPRTIGSLSSLTRLYISHNLALSDVPTEILNLSRKCLITLEDCNLFLATFLETLLPERLTAARLEYRGPRISYSVIKKEKFIKKLLEKLCLIVERTSIELLRLKKTEELCSWLKRLSDIADFKKRGDLQKALATKVLNYLIQANDDQEFRKVFYTVIQDAAETCGDRMALSILHLGLAYKLATIDLKDIQTLANFLKGLWAINILEDFARYKIAALRFSDKEVDEIEVYLGYPIKLKEILNLPIDIQEMLYFDCSALEDKDLQDAKSFVLSKQKNQEEYLDFLMNHDTWIKALSVNYQEEYQNILHERMEAFELEKLDEEAIEQKFRKQLTELTETALQINIENTLGKNRQKT